MADLDNPVCDDYHAPDASVMPDLPEANTHLTTVAIAERLIRKMR